MINGKKILIIGGTGSLGKMLVRRFLDNEQKTGIILSNEPSFQVDVGQNEIVVFSRDEAKQWSLRNEYKGEDRLLFEIGDMRDKDRVRAVIRDHSPDIVIIAAAMKHVDICELSPLESIKTNILGVENVVSVAAEEMCGGIVCMVSTDKACHSINVYGMCKSIAERVVLEYARRDNGNKYVAVRYGNVLESRGSIIPLFKYQAENNEALTLTHKDMTRFIMTLEQSAELIEQTILYGGSGETWIPKLPSMRIKDLVDIFSDMHGKPVKVMGMRPGEKIHESLINPTEFLRLTDDAHKDYYVLRPVFSDAPLNDDDREYTSRNNPLGKEELLKYLEGLGVLNSPISDHVGKSVEEIRTS